MLEHVGQTGLAHGVLSGARIDQSEEGENRRLRPLADKEREPVWQFLYRDALFERRHVLSGRKRR